MKQVGQRIKYIILQHIHENTCLMLLNVSKTQGNICLIEGQQLRTALGARFLIPVCLTVQGCQRKHKDPSHYECP